MILLVVIVISLVLYGLFYREKAIDEEWGFNYWKIYDDYQMDRFIGHLFLNKNISQLIFNIYLLFYINMYSRYFNYSYLEEVLQIVNFILVNYWVNFLIFKYVIIKYGELEKHFSGKYIVGIHSLIYSFNMYLYLSKDINTFGFDALCSLLCGDLLSHFTGAVSGIIVYLYFNSSRGIVVPLLMCLGMALLLIEFNRKWRLKIKNSCIENSNEGFTYSEEEDQDESKREEEYFSDNSIYSVESVDYGGYITSEMIG